MEKFYICDILYYKLIDSGKKRTPESFMKKIFLALSISFFFTLSSCDKIGGSHEGVIEYDAAPIDANNPMASLAPSKMSLKYKDDKTCMEISAGMGLFFTTVISNPETKTLTQTVKLLNKKVFHVFDSQAIEKEVAKMPAITIEQTTETKEIAGYKCKKAIVKFNDNSHPPFSIYYTDAIKIADANWNSPFKQIDGVLMEYQVDKYGMEMKFTAKTVNKIEVDDATFESPKDYKEVSQKELDEMFQAFD